MVNEYARTPFAELVQWKAQIFHFRQTNEAQRAAAAALNARIAEKLGRAAPRGDGVPRLYGYASRHSLLFLVPDFLVPVPETTLPQFLNWLRENGCTKIRYNLTPFGFDDDPTN
jgi:hypothetical protein